MQEIENVANPRRVQAKNSVCLKKSPSYNAGSNTSHLSNLAASGEEGTSHIRRDGSQAAQSARSWFDDSNKNVFGERGSKFYADDDPPFFLRNKSLSDESLPNPYKPAPSTTPTFLNRFPNATSLLSRNQTNESSSEDFRAVIDDLTIENRKLRKKLRKYEQVHCGELQGEKMFELRIHALPASKKRKLEKALQEFASSLGDGLDDELLTSTYLPNLSKFPARRTDAHHNPSSSGTSNSRTFGDSAYASMSNSSNTHLPKGQPSRDSIEGSANDQAVKAYLKNLSRGLLPKHPPVLTEITKKQVVVQRLEQLFTGSRDHTSKESQSKQQQEVSQSAATADRRTSEAEGHPVAGEGRRESRIFISEEDVNLLSGLPILERTDTDNSETTSSSTAATPDQRPTRPLDLDPSRAQIPEENIGYMKHLGFDSPHMQVEKSLAEDEGWIYLNLLTSMAQLHILNVTPEFVRNAVREISTQLELSSDNARIRWKGGQKPTSLSLESGEVSTHSSNDAYDLALAQVRNSTPSKSLENQSGTDSGNNQSSHDLNPRYSKAFDRRRPMLLDQTTPVDRHQYRPLFYHDNISSASGGYSHDDDKNSSPSSGTLNSSKSDPDGENHGGNTNKKVSRSRLSRGADPIIFYNRARFYTDLSKDDESMPYNCPLYVKNVEPVIGIEDNTSDLPDQEDKGPLSRSIIQQLTPKLEDLEIFPTIQGLAEDTQPLATGNPHNPTRSIPFEASGIGGVVPGDNFAISVEIQLQHQASGQKITTKVVSSETTDMLPSNLPPPSYAFLQFSSSSDSDDEGSESDGDAEMVDEDAYEEDVKAYIPPKFLNSFSSEENSENADEDDMSDDSSIDMLAHARALEPETVAAAEREFDENISSIYEDEDADMDIGPPSSSIVAMLGDQSFEKDEPAEKPRLESYQEPITAKVSTMGKKRTNDERRVKSLKRDKRSK